MQDALIPLDESGLPFALTAFEADGRKYVAALARLRHAPYEVIAVIAERTGNGYRVVGIDSLVDQ